jgi:uncharacterized protein
MRDRALLFLQQHVKTPYLVKHCLAVETIMAALAARFKEDDKNWRLAGLLHDVDVETTRDDFSKHGALGAQWIEEEGFPKEVAAAVRAHNSQYGAPNTLMEKSLICADAISGLIIAAALVIPSKKLADLKPENIVRRFGEKKFAAGVSREEIMKCKDIGFTLEEFANISLKALQGAAKELGL